MNLSEKTAVIVGGSWGSMLGMIVAMERPDLICHLGLRGVFVNGARNEVEANAFALKRMKELGFDDRTFSIDGHDRRACEFVRSLQGIPATDPRFAEKLIEQRQLLHCVGGVVFKESSRLPLSKWVLAKEKGMEIALAPEVSLKDMLGFRKAMIKSLNDMWHEMVQWDGTQVHVDMPVTVCHGRHDHNTFWGWVDDFVGKMKAPDKQLVWFERSGHSPHIEETAKFIDVLLARMPAP